MFVLIALAIWSGMNAYVIWRLTTLPIIADHVPRGIVIAAGVFLASSWVVSRIIGEVRESFATRALEWIGAEWMGALLLALACFFAADVVTGFGRFFPAQAVSARYAAAIMALLLTAIASINALRAPVVRDQEVRMPNLPQALDGTVVVAISDLHLGTMEGARWFAARADQIEALHPDLLLVAGDIVEGEGPRASSRWPEVLKKARARLGVVAIPGNHDRDSPQADALLTKNGFRMLRDSAVEVAPGLFVAGVDTPGHQRVAGRGRVDRALATVPAGAATILLHHYPEQVQIAARSGVGLMISGHTHAGQVWPFGLFVRLAYPYFAGRYEIGSMPLIVGRGTGTWGPRMRLWYPNEMLRIVLRRQSAM